MGSWFDSSPRYHLTNTESNIMAGAFKRGEEKLERKGMSKKEAGGIMYNAGKAKYGKAGMARKAAAGRARARGR